MYMRWIEIINKQVPPLVKMIALDCNYLHFYLQALMNIEKNKNKIKRSNAARLTTFDIMLQETSTPKTNHQCCCI
jgi:hypothetical protein